MVATEQGIFDGCLGTEGGGCVQVDRVVIPIFWIVDLDRGGKFTLRFVRAYLHNSSQGPLFPVFSAVLGALDCSHSIFLTIILHRSSSALVFKHDLPSRVNFQSFSAPPYADIIPESLRLGLFEQTSLEDARNSNQADWYSGIDPRTSIRKVRSSDTDCSTWSHDTFQHLK